MNLFDTSYNGKYETDHIHIVLEEDIVLSEKGLENPKIYGLFVHEYIHYYQHFGTLYGSQFCKMSNLLFLETRLFLKDQGSVRLPFGIWQFNKYIDEYRKRKLSIAGSRTCGYTIDDIEINELEIELAKTGKRAVNIGVYDYGNDVADEKGFSFGYYCIIEYMAHAVQQMINPEVEHNQVPYTAVELICRKIFPELLRDKKQLVTICMCSLMYDNPGVGFFDVIKYFQEHSDLKGPAFYEEFMQTTLISYKGYKYSLDYVGETMLSEYRMALEQQCGCSLQYYNKVIGSFIGDFRKAKNGLLEWLYNGDVNDRKQFLALIDVYGVPCIETPNCIQLPLSTDRRPYLETAALMGFELWFRRFQKMDGDVCPWYHICKKTEYDENSKVDEYCGKEQWKKTIECLMSVSLRYYKLDKIKFIA